MEEGNCIYPLRGGRFLATHKSAEKRSKQSEKRRVRNAAIRSNTKTHVKSVISAVEVKNRETSEAALAKAVPVIAKAAAKGVFHSKTASRKISRLARKVNTLPVRS